MQLLEGAKAKVAVTEGKGKGVVVEKANAPPKESELQMAEDSLKNLLKHQASCVRRLTRDDVMMCNLFHVMCGVQCLMTCDVARAATHLITKLGRKSLISTKFDEVVLSNL